jgi:heat shock protein HtpX
MRAILMLVLTNLAILATVSIVWSVVGAMTGKPLGGAGFHDGIETVLLACAVLGFTGAYVSLLMSKLVAKWSTGLKTITGHEGPGEAWLVGTVERLAQRAGIRTPEVGIYEGTPNAFATGAFRNSALVGVSTGLLKTMPKEEVEAVLAHEVAHIANGDMQTMTLVQGVLNTFVYFFARLAGYFVDRVVLKNEEDAPGVGYWITNVIAQIFFGILATLVLMAYSRHREYRADWGAAELMGRAAPMQQALGTLLRMQSGSGLPTSMAAMGINGGKMLALFSSHPPLESRIEKLHAFGR